MGTNTPRLNLFKPSPSDLVDVTTDISANYDLIDSGVALDAHAHSGTYVAVGTTNVDVSSYGDDLVAAMAAGPSVARYIINKPLYTPSATLVLNSGTVIEGVGPGASTIKLPDGANRDLIKTYNFDALTGTSPAEADVPTRFALRHLVLDGNQANNASGIPLRMFGRSYLIDDVVIQNGKSGGAYSEYRSGGSDMEARWSNFKITDCAGIELEWRGPHDSQFVNGIVCHPIAGATHGIKLVAGAQIGGEQFTNVHAWGDFATAPWEIGTSNGQFINCYSDGGGIILVGSGNTWDGFILGTNTPGQFVVKLGDGTVRNVGQNTVRGRVSGFKASPYSVMTPSTTSTGNRFHATANMGGVTRYASKGNVYTTTSSTAAGAGTIAMSATTDLPASGTLYADDGTNRTTTLAYTGKTSNSLTGVTGVPAGGLNSGAALWLVSTFNGATDFGVDSFEVWDYDNSGSVPGQILRRATPNSQGAHNATDVWTGKIHAQEGFVLVDPTSGAQAGKVFGGSGAPTASETAGDFYVRTDTPKVPEQRLYVCTGGTTWVAIAASTVGAYKRPTGVLAETWPARMIGSSGQSVLTSGLECLQLIWLDAGTVVTTIAYQTAGAMSALTHQWFSLRDASRVLLRVTSDDLTTAWGSNTTKALNVQVGGVDTVYTVPTSAFYYLGIMVAGTVGSMQAATGNTVMMTRAPIVAGHDATNTGLTTPATAPGTSAALTADGAVAYGEIR